MALIFLKFRFKVFWKTLTKKIQQIINHIKLWTKSEVYFSFQNDYEGSDIIINLKVGKGFTTYCYIYDSYDKIETNEKGEYINSFKEFTLTENFFLLKSSELSIKKNKILYCNKRHI